MTIRGALAGWAAGMALLAAAWPAAAQGQASPGGATSVQVSTSAGGRLTVQVEAGPLGRGGGEEASPGVTLSRLTVTLPDGEIARGAAVSWKRGGGYRLEAVPADPDRLTLTAQDMMLQGRPGIPAAVSVNGGYHLSALSGVGNGPTVTGGSLQSSSTLHGDLTELIGGRGTVASVEGRLLYDRAGAEVFIMSVDGDLALPVEINRPSGPWGGSLHTPEGAHLVRIPAGGAAYTLGQVDLDVGVRRRLTVTGTVTSGAQAAGETVLVVGPEYAGSIRPGDLLELTVELRSATGELNGTSPEWAVPGGPLLLTDGRPTPASWQRGLDRDQAEALSDSHRHGRHPRTAAASGAGRDMLVVIDGRQPGWSSGVTLDELTAVLVALGADDAVNLDGGGPSQMLGYDQDGPYDISRPADRTRGSSGLLALIEDGRWGAPDATLVECPDGTLYAVRDSIWHSPTELFRLEGQTGRAAPFCTAEGGQEDAAVGYIGPEGLVARDRNIMLPEAGAGLRSFDRSGLTVVQPGRHATLTLTPDGLTVRLRPAGTSQQR